MTPLLILITPNTIMHYRNGREAKNGDKVAQIESQSGKVTAVGALQNATPGNDYCNGQIVVDGGQAESGRAGHILRDDPL